MRRRTGEFVPHRCSVVGHGELKNVVVPPAHIETEHLEGSHVAGADPVNTGGALTRYNW